MKFRKEFNAAYDAEFARLQTEEQKMQTCELPSFASWQRIRHDAAILAALKRVAILEAQERKAS